ncbi:AMP-binding protein [Streptomyces sp. NPDC005302]|uniref:AMP-binding protein n=1 Tax=Streptomyces sp. NPDC005302 TaxID=3154675 RepID=UPI0033BF0F18
MPSFGASSAHQGLWRAQEMASDTPNHALTMWDVDGDLDTAVMESAFLHVMGEAEVLRVTFTERDGHGLRLVPRELGDWRPFLLDLAAEPDPEQGARDALADLVREPFDLERDLLFRLGVVKLAADRSLLVIAYHHLISDGFGAGGLLSRRLAEAYTALAEGRSVPPLEHAWDTASFTAESDRYLASPQFTEDTAFWRDYLKDAPPPARLPRPALSDTTRDALAEPLSSADRWSQVAGAIGMASRTLTVPRAEADTWTRTAQSMGVWMSTMLTAAAAVFVRHRCDRPDFLLSLAVGNRVGVASRTPGLAVNVVPVRARVPLDATFTEIADTLVDETYEIFDHAACHYSDIQRAAGTTLSDRGSFGAVLNVVEFVQQLHFGDSPARYFGATTGTFDELSIGVYTDGSADSDLFIRLDAPQSLYTRPELRFIGEELIAHVRALVAAADQRVGSLDVSGVSGQHQPLTAAQDQLLTPVREQDREARPQAGQETVTGLFARQAARTPDAVALSGPDTTLTYRELDARSTLLARTLTTRTAGAETVVAVALPRSTDLAVALLAVAKAGAAWLPLDPAAAAGSLTAQATRSLARALLTDPATAATLPADTDIPVIVLDGTAPDTDPADGDGVDVQLPAPARPDSLFAVTDGSGPTGTGAPVALTHRNLSHFATDPVWRRTGEHTLLWHGPHTVEALALELWMPLLNGGRVVVTPPGEPESDTLTRAGGTDHISTLWLPAARLTAIAAQHPERLAPLREVITGGDRVPAAALRRIREACPHLTITTGHGSGESTVFTARHRLTPDQPLPPAGTIGHPPHDTTLHVLGPGLAPVPAGVTGELYVAGPGVTRGYPGDPATTATRFVPCPSGPPGSLMHRTGERVHRDEDGRVTHIGGPGTRAELRGTGIELAEIEEALAEHPALAQSAVTVRPDTTGRPRLLAYVVPAPSQSLAADELRRFTAARLPEPLVPALFTVLDQLPLTPGGRIDRTALPDLAPDDDTYKAPRNDTEKILAAAFADVLELDRVGIDEDFFDLGGNSLRAIRLVGLIRAELNQEVSIRRLFAARTVMGLSDMWQDLARSSRPSLRRRTSNGAVL